MCREAVFSHILGSLAQNKNFVVTSEKPDPASQQIYFSQFKEKWVEHKLKVVKVLQITIVSLRVTARWTALAG